MQPGEFFEFNVHPSRGHQYKLYKKLNVSCVRSTFFSERLVNVWNSLPDSTDFSTLPRFRRSIQRVSFIKFLKCFSVMMFYVFLLLCVCVSLLKSLHCN